MIGAAGCVATVGGSACPGVFDSSASIEQAAIAPTAETLTTSIGVSPFR